MDDDEFDDLFGEVELLQDAPSESLTPPAIETIEKIFQSIADTLAEGQNEISVTLRTRPRSRAQLSRSTSQQSDPAEGPRLRRLAFPGKTADEAWRFSTSALSLTTYGTR